MFGRILVQPYADENVPRQLFLKIYGTSRPSLLTWHVESSFITITTFRTWSECRMLYTVSSWSDIPHGLFKVWLGGGESHTPLLLFTIYYWRSQTMSAVGFAVCSLNRQVLRIMSISSLFRLHMHQLIYSIKSLLCVKPPLLGFLTKLVKCLSHSSRIWV